MLDIKYIKENVEEVKKAAINKFIKVDIDRLIDLDTQIKALTTQIDGLRTERNKLSEIIPTLSGEEKMKKISFVKELKEKIAPLEETMAPLQEEYKCIMLDVPGVPLPDVPFGKTDADNVEIKRVGKIPEFKFEIKDHVDLAESLDLIDMGRASKVAGSRTYYLKNDGLILELALTRYVIDFLVEKGFDPMRVPTLVKEEAMIGTGYFPGGLDSAYKVPEDNLFLVGTSEVALVAYNMNETFTLDELPKLYAGYSQCYRREAGTYGKDTRGLYRVHEFTKIEQVVMCENSYDESLKLHNFILNNVEEILEALELPYRVVKVCTGDMGQGQIRKHDVEVWMPSRNGYCETHSCSSFHEFQARRCNIKYKDKSGEIKYVHTLNNTAIASPRVLIPLIELNQNEDGSITIPKVLRPYMGNRERIEARK